MDKHLNGINGNQSDKLADRLIEVAEMENPPLHLVLGSDALGLAEANLAELKKAFDASRGISVSMDF